jgi:MFS family permease
VTDEDRTTVSRRGTARALVLLASGLAVAAAALTFFGALVFGPALLDRHGRTGPVLLGTAAFCVFVLVAALLANVLAVRADTVSGVVARGCGTLLGGTVIGLAVLLILISSSA